MHINQMKFKKLFAFTIFYMHIHFLHDVNLYVHVTRMLKNMQVT